MNALITPLTIRHAAHALLGQSASSTSLVTEVRWNWDWPLWATAAAAVAILAWVVVLYAREQRFVSGRVRAALAVLRLAAVAIVVVMLAQPTIERRRVARPRLAVLVDRSASMITEDVPAADLPARSGATVSEGTMLSRLDARNRILSAGARPLLDALRANYDVDLVPFDAKAERIEAQPGAPVNEWLAQTVIDADDDSSDATRLGDAIDYALRQLAGPPPAAIVALTDGVSTSGLPLSEAAQRARTIGVPLYLVALGSDRPRPDVALDDVLAERVVFPGDRLQIEATLRAVGYDGQPARVALEDAATGQTIAETQTTLPADGATRMVRLALRPTEPGPQRLRLAVDQLPGETDAENNRAELTIDVRAQPIRTLLVDSTPSYEYRALKSLLERDPAIDLKVRLQEADADYAAVDERAIRDFPASESALLVYDVVLLGDFDPDLVPRQAWANLEKFVTLHGGGLGLIAGPRFMPQAYRDVAAMRTLLPIELPRANPLRAEPASVAGYAIDPTAFGADDASLQLGETPEESAAIWAALPPVLWLLEAPQVKPGVVVLAEHPLRSDASGRPLPAIVRQYVGVGEVLMHLTDETWRWRWRNDDRYFARYWGQAVRRLARGRAIRGAGSLATNRPAYQVGEPVTLRARLGAGMRLDDASAKVELEATAAATRQLELARKATPAGTFETVLRDLPADSYTARLIAGDGRAPLAATFTVAAPPGEMARLVVNSIGLAEAARATGGRFYTAQTARRLLTELPPSTPTAVEQLPDEPLWNSHWLLLGLCLTLGGEWLLRRRLGML